MQRVVSIIVLAMSLFTVTFAVNIQAPLYSVYASASSVGSMAVTVAFAAYVAGLLPTLVLLGGLSDRIGRRLPIAVALLLGAVAILLLSLSPTWESLVLARILLGIGTGLATTSGVAYMCEIMGANKSRSATTIVTSVTSLGFGGGALATSLSLKYQGITTAPLSFIFLMLVSSTLSCALVFLPRSHIAKKVSLFRFPVFPHGTWAYGVAMALAWSTTGMIIAIVPLKLSKLGLNHWIGVVVFLSIFVGFLCQPISRQMSPSKSLALGYFLVPFGFLILVGGVWFNSLIMILSGAGITSAASYGFTYLSALTKFSESDPKNRARSTAGLFLYAYGGFSLPVIMSGAIADRFGLTESMFIFLVFLIVVTSITVFIWRRSTINSVGDLGAFKAI